MATNYPGSLDDFATTSPAKLSDDDSTGRTHAERHNDVESAVEAIQGELGTDPAGAQATVKARFDYIERHGNRTAGVWESGGWYGTATTTATAITAGFLSNTLYLVPWVCPVSVTIDRLSVYVASAGNAGDNARLGIYSATTGGVPGSLLLNAGEIDISSTGVKELTVSQALTAGTLYWLAVLSESSAGALSAHPNASGWMIGAIGNSDITTGIARVSAPRTYSSGFDSTAPAWSSLTLATSGPFLFMMRRT